MTSGTTKRLRSALIASVAATMVALPGLAASSEPVMVELPITGPLYMRATETGASVIVSADGRFVLPGRLIDRQRDHAVVLSVADAAKAYHPVPVQAADTNDSRQALSIDPEQLLSFTIGDTGKGHEEVFVWFDPTCPHCHTLLQMQHELTDRYVFHNLLIPLLGSRAETLVEQLACAESDDERARAILTRASSINGGDECNFDQLRTNHRLASAMGVNAVPFVITPDRRMASGTPRSVDALREFLEGQ